MGAGVFCEFLKKSIIGQRRVFTTKIVCRFDKSVGNFSKLIFFKVNITMNFLRSSLVLTFFFLGGVGEMAVARS